ncbi:hypothetical protein CALCODRAFT_508795 [Calocera cornea HHB12733]|uniref:F-box domain-containing protein n=1 Tax=Calocera cornea HHB12733 TaxID=1353952 RepID=A0A165G1M0_9BASI|nr:hypothetical protein CALCODRAFT_508795 [Calocera cornea HHB12733]
MATAHSPSAASTRTGVVPRLPHELYEAIIAFVPSRADLLQLCLVNSLLHDIAVRYLYCHLRLKDFKRAIGACRLILKKPEVAGYITQLEADFGEVPDWIVHQWPKPKIFLHTFAPAYCRVMFRAFRLMGNLQHLTFKNTSPLGRLPAKNLALSGIASQPLLEDLEIHDGPSFSIPALQKSAIPTLRRLAAFHEDAKYLIPGRPVIQFRPLDTLLEEHVPGCLKILSQSTGPLRHLKLLMMRIDGLFFVRASAAIPDLVDLIIHSMENVEYTVSQELHMPDVLNAFQSFRALENLELHSYYDRPAAHYFPPIGPLGRACPTLRTFTIIDELRGDSERKRMPANQMWRDGRALTEGDMEWWPRVGFARTPPPRPGAQVALVEWTE